MNRSFFVRVFDWASNNQVAFLIQLSCVTFLLGFVYGKYGDRERFKRESESLKAISQKNIELTIERMRTDALQKQLDVMRADELYRQMSVSNVLLQIDDILRKVKP